ncbi:hypothetical protein [Siphonobacter curvatus]|uniref:Uncharacterized protein n=1 Tax=Siphonobacter curvatus TaxID=2094562 RepID=A0A2S7IPW2_9BACT|nr:hypothetical protein [Siphonobacter curvatus]PQA59668.1 hypothetical protein C5O19_08555 [Siphonobacter curvatus]
MALGKRQLKKDSFETINPSSVAERVYAFLSELKIHQIKVHDQLGKKKVIHVTNNSQSLAKRWEY